MASIAWTDSTGAATLTNGKPAPADRLSGWTPDSAPVGPRRAALGTGVPVNFRFRSDHVASFELRLIPRTSMALMLRLQHHLRNSGVVSVTTGDSVSAVYASCYLAPGADVSIELTDPRRLEYTMSFKLLNSAGNPMLCQY